MLQAIQIENPYIASMKIKPIDVFQIGNNFPVESNIFGNYPLSIKDGFIVFRVTGKDNRKSYGFLAWLFPENKKVLLPHESVIPWKVLSKKQEAQVGSSIRKPVCLLYESNESLTKHLIFGFDEGKILTHFQQDNCLYEYVIQDDAEWTRRLTDFFSDQDHVVIADGHHRSAAFLELREESDTGSGLFCALLSLNQIEVQSCHRKIRINDADYSDFFVLLEKKYEIQDLTIERIPKLYRISDSDDKYILMYGNGMWRRLQPKSGEMIYRPGSADLLARFESEILIPFFRKTGLQADDMVRFIPGSELNMDELKLDFNEFLFLFPPVSREFLWDAARNGEILPAKSTWIEPRMPTDIIQVPSQI